MLQEPWRIFAQAMRLNPKSAPAYYGAEWCGSQAASLRSRLPTSIKALSLDARLEHAYANRGLAFLSLGKRAEAESDFRLALARAPGLRAELEESIRVIERLKK